jgi:fatty acid desaturase
MRIRAIAEHSMIDDPKDPLRNTRTTLTSWWERIFIAPNRVNYHLEHHLFMGMPLYSLPKLHRLLSDRGVLKNACISYGYAGILRKAGAALADPEAGTGSSQTLTFG